MKEIKVIIDKSDELQRGREGRRKEILEGKKDRPVDEEGRGGENNEGRRKKKEK